MENTNTSGVPGIALWVGLSVASAFFSSLERFACVHLHTYDTDDEDDEEEATNIPAVAASASAASATSDDKPSF